MTQMVKMSDVRLLIKMLRFAAEKHKNQRRYDKDKTPYINHPIEVAYLIVEYTTIKDLRLLMSALGHDLKEDQDVSGKELQDEFGGYVSSVIGEVSDDDTLTKKEIKQAQIDTAHKKSKGAAILKTADKIASMIDMIENPPPWQTNSKIKSFKHSKEVIERLPDISDVAQPLLDYFYVVYERGIESFKKKKR